MVRIGIFQYDAETWSQPRHQGRLRSWFNGDDSVLSYNEAISTLAEQSGAIFVDLYHYLEGAFWLLTGDACQLFSDVGQHLIGQYVFAHIARCSFVTHSSRRSEEALQSSVWNTGGTDALPDVVRRWRRDDLWKGLQYREDWL